MDGSGGWLLEMENSEAHPIEGFPVGFIRSANDKIHHIIPLLIYEGLNKAHGFAQLS